MPELDEYVARTYPEAAEDGAHAAFESRPASAVMVEVDRPLAGESEARSTPTSVVPTDAQRRSAQDASRAAREANSDLHPEAHHDLAPPVNDGGEVRDDATSKGESQDA